MNPYEVLGAPADADMETLRALYRQLVRLHHPDRALDEAARRLANERMTAINHAWHIVNDPQRRAAYDASERWKRMDDAHSELRHQPPAPAAASAKESERQQRESELLEQRLRRPMRRSSRRERKERELNALLQARLREKVSGQKGGSRAKTKKGGASARLQLLEATRLFWEQDRPAEAIALCNRVLRVDNRNVPARELLGDFYLRLGRGDRALSLWEQALVLAPDNAAIRRKLRALRPHDARSYKPQPRIPGRSQTLNEQLATRISVPSTLSFWNRARLRLARFFRGF